MITSATHCGLALVAIVNENEHGELELGIALSGGACLTPRGAEMLNNLGKRLQHGIQALVADFANEQRAEVRERPDLAIEVAGERPKA